VISRQPLVERIWVYINKKRYDAELVATDSVADIAIIKVDGYLPYRFRIATAQEPPRLNLPVSALGYHAMPDDAGPSIVDTPLATTQGQISFVFLDKAGTRWIRHTAAVKPGASGGPLVAGDVVIGINTKGGFGITSALDVAPFHEWVQTAIEDWRRKKQKEAGS
jgi:S1-C subfamily serine protease